MNKSNQMNGIKSGRTQKKKSVIIAVVAIGAILILLLLVLFGKQFVGQAITPGTSTEGEAGIILIDSTVSAGESFTIPIKANIGADKTAALGFVLNHPGLALNGACNNAVIIDLPESWKSGLTEINCADNQIVFSGGTADPNYVLTGEISIASVKFQGANAGTYNLAFPTFDVIDLETETNLITAKINGEIVVARLSGPPPPPPPSPQPVECEEDKTLISSIMENFGGNNPLVTGQVYGKACCQSSQCAGINNACHDFGTVLTTDFNSEMLCDDNRWLVCYDDDVRDIPPSGDYKCSYTDWIPLVDNDNDDISDTIDNCPVISNPLQTDKDGDDLGNACDTDDDNDGSLDTGDCKPLISTIYPGAVEVCGDGIDQDCDGDDTACDTDASCPSVDWSNVCCVFIDVEFMNFMNAFNAGSSTYTDPEFMDFINMFNNDLPLCAE